MSEHIRAVRASVYSLSSVCVSINIFHGAMITFVVRCRQSTVGPPHISHARCDTVIKQATHTQSDRAAWHIAQPHTVDNHWSLALWLHVLVVSIS